MFLWVRMTVGQAEQIPLSIVTQTITGEKVKKKKMLTLHGSHLMGGRIGGR